MGPKRSTIDKGTKEIYIRTVPSRGIQGDYTKERLMPIRQSRQQDSCTYRAEVHETLSEQQGKGNIDPRKKVEVRRSIL